MATRSRGEVPVGRVEALVNTDDGMTVVGWGYDADAPHGGLVVRAAIDGDRVVDLASTGTDHGFSAILPADVRLPLCLWLVDAGIPRHDSSLGCHRPRPVPDWDPPTG